MKLPKGEAARESIAALIMLVVAGFGINEALGFRGHAGIWPIALWVILCVLAGGLLIGRLIAANMRHDGP